MCDDRDVFTIYCHDISLHYPHRFQRQSTEAPVVRAFEIGEAVEGFR